MHPVRYAYVRIFRIVGLEECCEVNAQAGRGRCRGHPAHRGDGGPLRPGAAAADWSRCLDGTTDRQAVFARAATVSGVPESVLLGVSFMQSRWDDHGTSPSTSGGYGPMHLTQVDASAVADPHLQGKGESAHAHEGDAGTSDSPGVDPAVDGLFTLDEAAGLVGATPARLRADDVANICGGAALLASYQRDLGPDGSDGSGATGVAGWSAAVAKYSGAADEASALRFAEQVFTVIREGRSRVTNDGQRVTLAATPARVDREAVASMGLAVASTEGVDCPEGLGCESIPAPYEKYGDSRVPTATTTSPTGRPTWTSTTSSSTTPRRAGTPPSSSSSGRTTWPGTTRCARATGTSPSTSTAATSAGTPATGT